MINIIRRGFESGVYQTVINRGNISEYIDFAKRQIFANNVIISENILSDSVYEPLRFPKKIISGVDLCIHYVPVSGPHNEVMAIGLSGLSERLSDYQDRGIVFGKIEIIFNFDQFTPSDRSIGINIGIFTEFVNVSVREKVIPVVEFIFVFPDHACCNRDMSDFNIKYRIRKILAKVQEKLDLLNIDIDDIVLTVSVDSSSHGLDWVRGFVKKYCKQIISVENRMTEKN